MGQVSLRCPAGVGLAMVGLGASPETCYPSLQFAQVFDGSAVPSSTERREAFQVKISGEAEATVFITKVSAAITANNGNLKPVYAGDTVSPYLFRAIVDGV